MLNYVGTAEAGKITGLVPAYIKELCRKGKIPGAQKVGGQWMIPREQIETKTKKRP